LFEKHVAGRVNTGYGSVTATRLRSSYGSVNGYEVEEGDV
jgi:hypothetical protein